jgi:hypothetical protein
MAKILNLNILTISVFFYLTINQYSKIFILKYFSLGTFVTSSLWYFLVKIKIHSNHFQRNACGEKAKNISLKMYA